MQKNQVFRWITVGALIIQFVFFFLPYYSAGGFGMGISVSGFDLLKLVMKEGPLMGFILLCFYILFAMGAGILLAIRENIVTYTISTFVSFYTMLFNFILFGLLASGLTGTGMSGISAGPGAGLIFNTLLIIAALVFSIIQMVQFKSTISSAFNKGKTDFGQMQQQFQSFVKQGDSNPQQPQAPTQQQPPVQNQDNSGQNSNGL